MRVRSLAAKDLRSVLGQSLHYILTIPARCQPILVQLRSRSRNQRLRQPSRQGTKSSLHRVYEDWPLSLLHLCATGLEKRDRFVRNSVTWASPKRERGCITPRSAFLPCLRVGLVLTCEWLLFLVDHQFRLGSVLERERHSLGQLGPGVDRLAGRCPGSLLRSVPGDRGRGGQRRRYRRPIRRLKAPAQPASA